jgi:NAD+ kinase
LRHGDFVIEPETKVEGWVKGTRKRLVGLNEVNVCHRDPTRAIRFNLHVDDALLAANVIGDGVIVATPYGSTAYYASIARRSFDEGLGIAFNNARTARDTVIVDENSVISVNLLRGPGWLCADNRRTKFRLYDGDVVEVRKAKSAAHIVAVKGFDRKIGF